MDTMAHALVVADSILAEGELDRRRDERYGGWNDGLGQEILDGKHTLATLHDAQIGLDSEPTRVSGRQEALENLVARHLDTAR